MRVAEPPAEALSAKREVVVVLRLVVGSDGRIVYGYILDPGRRPAGPFRFSGLSRAVRDWIGVDPDVVGSSSGVPAEQ
jgi:hypothetical protein